MSGVLFALAPLTGVPLSGVLAPGRYSALANAYIRFGGYLGRTGPPPDYLGAGLAVSSVASVVVARRRAVAWILVTLALAALWLSLGQVLISAPPWLGHLWLPWRELSSLPVLREILPNQLAPFVALFVALLLAVGLDAFADMRPRRGSWVPARGFGITGAVTAVVAVLALVPVLVTFDVPYRVVNGPHAALRAPGGADAARGHRGAHRAVRVLRVDHPHAVAGSGRHALPAGRCRAEDTRAPWRPRAAWRPRLGPADPERPDHRGSPLPAGTAGQLRRVRARLAAVAGREGRDRRGQPRPGVRLGVLHHGPRRGAALRAARLGVDAGPGPAAGATGHRRVAGRDAGPRRASPPERGHPLAMSRCVLAGSGGT